MKINLFAIAGLSIAVVCFLLAFIIFLNSRRKLHRIWAFFNISVGLFGLGTVSVAISNTYQEAFFGWKFTLFGVSFIAMFFYHFIYEFCGLNNKRMLAVVYVHGILFAVLGITTNLIFHKMRYVFNQFYYYEAGIGFNILCPLWLFFVFSAFFNLFRYIHKAKGLILIQGRYLFWGMLLGFLSGSTTSFPSWGVDIYPAWDFFICVYAMISTYAILRYQLLDVKVVFTRAGIFVLVYAIVLGLPFYIYKTGDHFVALVSMSFFATIGPSIFIYLQRKAENNIFQEEKRIQDVFLSISNGLSTMSDRRQLSNLLISVFVKNLKLEHVLIYIFDLTNNTYFLQDAHPQNNEGVVINEQDALIRYLKEKKEPILYEEIKFNLDTQNKQDPKFQELVLLMQKLSAEVIIPVIGANNLLGFIVLGERPEKKTYSSDFINVLKILGNEMALALQIIMSQAERDKLLNENFEIRRFESLGLLCNSMSHQMNNRFMGQVSLLFNPLDIYSEGKYKNYSREELIELLEDLAECSKRVDAIAKEGGKLTKDILNFSRGNMDFGVVKFDDMVNQSFNFLEQKYPNFKFELIRDYPKDVLLWGSELGIKDLIYNAVDNSFFSMKVKQEKDKSYMPKITIRGKVFEGVFHFEIEDNGVGIKKEDLKKVMDPMFSTKSHKDGSGMGTTFMQQIVQKHEGTITYDSEWEHWAKVIISLPLATQEQKGESKRV